MGKTTYTPHWPQDVIDGLLQDFPFPIYCTTLESGRFRYVNTAFEALLECDLTELLKPGCTAASFYADGDVRHAWRRELTHHRDKVIVFDAELQRPWSPNNFERLHVLDCARVYRHDNQDLVLGLLVDVTRYAFDWELNKSRLDVLTRILDLPYVNIGVHHVDSMGRVEWMNARERLLMWLNDDRERTSKDWLKDRHRVADLSPTDRTAKHCRVLRKLRGTNPLTEGQHRTFITQDAGRTPTLVPVNICDFGIPNPRAVGNRFVELYTVVRNETALSEKTAITGIH